MNLIEITDFHAPELDVYARLTEAQLLNRFEPKKGMFIAESPKVIMRALDAGCKPVSLLVERSHINEEAAEAIRRCGDVPVYTAEQYARVQAMAEAFVADALRPALDEIHHMTAAALGQHTPKHLQDQVEAVTFVERHTSDVSLPAQLLIEEGHLIPNWHMGEMPTTYIVLKD